MTMSARASKPRRYIVICGTCGSEEVRVDAWAEWDPETQRWEVAQTFDAAFCDRCQGECSVCNKPEP